MKEDIHDTTEDEQYVMEVTTVEDMERYNQEALNKMEQHIRILWDTLMKNRSSHILNKLSERDYNVFRTWFLNNTPLYHELKRYS